jgi:hypothetical protein
MAYAVPPEGPPGPVGEGNFLVSEGDCIESISLRAGLLWTTIWNHPQNAALRKARVSPNVLLPGDRLYIPEKVQKTVDRPTEKRHFFIKKGVLSKLRICVKVVDEPRRDTPYTLVIDGKSQSGTTDHDGWIEVVIPPNAQSGELTVGVDPLHQQIFTLELGAMDPVTEILGIQKRLRNLGFDCEPTGQLDGPTSTAIAQFQKSDGLPPTGELDRLTIERLKGRYGS